MGQSWMLRTETTLWLLSGTVHPPTRYVGQSGWRVLQSRELSMTGAPQLKTQSCSATGHSCAKDWQAFAIRGRAGTVPCAAAGNVRVQPHRLQSCWEAQVLIWNAELAFPKELVPKCLPPYFLGAQGLLRVKEVVSMFAFCV